jgi:two-component sensor histidine kinase
VVSESAGHFSECHAQVLTELAGIAGIAFRMIQHERDLQAALERERLLAREMKHRVQNTLSVVDGIVRMSARNAASPTEMARTISGRLHALSAAQARARITTDETGSPGDLAELITEILRPFESDDASISAAGPALDIGPNASTSLALVVHELATNAMKYGALGRHANGRIDLRWSVERDILRLEWTETGSRPINGPPLSQGFGTTLCAKMVGQIEGSIRYDWRPEGLRVEVSAPVSALTS